jgi:DNA polymerase III delta prime subunit
MKNIELVISEAIKTGKWIDISYINSKKEITYYWIAIKDIDLKKKLLYASIFNNQKSLNSLDATIKFNSILSAKILEFTSYETPIELINKIEHNKEDSKWLKYETFNNNILRYYLKCNELDNDPFQKDTVLISGIDKDILLKKKQIILNEEQEKQILNYIKNYDGKKIDGEVNYLILSFLSIDEYDKKYIALYYDVRFNPSNKKLTINDIPRVNQSFLIKNKKHSLNSYIDIDPEEFTNNITNHLDEYLNEYTELIRSNLRDTEVINQMPEFMILQRNISANLSSTYNIIEEKIKNGTLDYPLKAFFGNSNRFGAKRKEPNIVIYDNKVNIDQMRVIYNTMKYPITYVQGPPGTGKTQTILNVILSAFFNSRTTLICSSNNKPINGILEKLKFSYIENDDVPFPYIRLGNRDEVAKSIKRILNLYNFVAKMKPNEEKLLKIKNKTNEENKNLLKHLETYETKRDLKLRLDSAKKLLESLENHSSHLYKNVVSQINDLQEQYKKMPIISNQDVLQLVASVSEDKRFKQYMYFESVKYINKLKLSRYEPLIEICKIKDENNRITAFNKWCSDDNNIKLLEDVFPIIITTNISSSRLGTANHTFNLVIMDEAGQSNIAHALLPIARAESLLLVGDTNQLKPVIVLEDIINDYLKKEYSISDDYDYRKYSILDIMKKHDNISKNIMLTYHYRCGKKIIDFSNKRFYNGKLNLEYLKEDGNLSLLNVKNINSKLRNENYEEAKAIIEYIKRNQLKDTAIITPFKNQQNLITKMINENEIKDVTCGTIHQVQGDEKNTIIISTSISLKTSRKTFEWIKNNSEITNVAVTRAKKNLIVVSDVEALNKLSTDKKDDLYSLVKYVANNGNIEIPPNESYTIQIGNSNGSKNEDIFFRTISHFCSVNNVFQAKRNIKVSSLFNNDPILSNSKLEFDVVLYKIKDNALIPKIAIELQGGEHFGNIDREKCDTRKSQICKEKGITLLEIPNSFAKSYETIKELILTSCGQHIEQLELF